MVTGEVTSITEDSGGKLLKTIPAPDGCAERTGEVQKGGRRQFIGRSGRLLIYTPPLIQLFIPSKAMAATPSSG